MFLIRLIAIALEEFTQYISKNSDLFDKKTNNMKTAIKLICEYLVVTKKPPQVYRHIRNVKNVEANPVNVSFITFYFCSFMRTSLNFFFQFYYETKKSPKTVHYVVPFNNYLMKAPKDHSSCFLPEIFREYLKEGGADNKENDNG